MTAENTRFSPFLKQCFVTTAVGFNLINHGSLTGFPAILLPQFYQPDSDIVSSKTADSWIASSLAITLFLGSATTPTVMDRFGRKAVHYIVTSLSVVSWFINIFAGNVEIILLARIIGGLSFGMALPLRSVLIGEYTSPKNRGAFLTTISLTQGFGLFFVHFVGSFLSWRKTSLVCLFLPLTSLVMTIFIPESPSWLVSRRRYDECKRVFRWLRGNEEEQELEAMIQARVELEKANVNKKKVNIIRSIHKPEFYKPIILMFHMFALPQFSGAVITATYSTTVIRLIMNPDVKADIWMVVLDSERIIVNTLAIFIINKIQRRKMVLGTISLCVLSQLSIAAYVYFKNSGLLTQEFLWIPGSLMIMHFFTIAVGMVPLPSVIAGEVFPLEYRSIAGSISLVSVSGNMFLVLKTFPALVDAIGISGVYVFYAACLTYCMVVIWFLLPETKGRTLQDIEDEYRGKVKISNLEEMVSLNSNNKTEELSKKENGKGTSVGT